MAKDDAHPPVPKDDARPPPFMKPGDNPELDRLVAKLKDDSDDGDPLFVKYRQKTAADGGGRNKPVAEALAKEAPAPTSGRKVPARWLAFAALAIVMPVVALAIGLLWARPPDVVLSPVSPTAATAAPTIAAPSASASASGLVTPSATATATAEPRLKLSPKKKPRAQADAGTGESAVSPDLVQ
jgi:hypothetical protein